MRASAAFLCLCVGCSNAPAPSQDAGSQDSGTRIDAGAPSDAGAVHTSMHGTGFDAFEGQTFYAVVFDGTTGTTLEMAASAVVSGEFLFAWPIVLDMTHYVFGYVYADENANGACDPSEHTWSVILYDPIQELTPATAASDCTHF